MKIKFFLTMTMIAVTVYSSDTVSEKDILGDWCAGSKNAFHEEFSLMTEDGKHIFSSWLHQHPAISGTWNLQNRTLTVYGSSDDQYIYSVETATSKQLILRENGKDPEVYVREGCIRFETPPME